MRAFLRPGVVLLVVGVVGLLELTAGGASLGGTGFGARVTPMPDASPGLGELQEALALQAPPVNRSTVSRRESSVPLASGALRITVERLERGQAAGEGVDVVGVSVRVEVLHDLSSPEARGLIEGVGGVVEGEINGLTQALVPVENLVVLESQEAVRYLRPPLEANVPILPASDLQGGGVAGVPIVGQEVAKTNADAWHAAGFTGSGVKVGIIDFFDGDLWDTAVVAGELPVPAGTFCQSLGAPCDIWEPGEANGAHGEGVAEIIHEMAPSAGLYVARARTTVDLQAAVDYFISNGVQIISRSLGSQYDGPGDGTGPNANVIDNAVASGLTWFNSAGNNAGGGPYLGSYWRGQWADADNDGWLEFAPGDELLEIECTFSHGVRWSDFGSLNPTDYDVYLFDDAPTGGNPPIDSSTDRQQLGALPLENGVRCREGEVDYVAILLYDEGNGPDDDILEFMTDEFVQYWQNAYSASGPASDSASPGALSIGAVDPALGNVIAPYSSQGPTNDERIKPDLSVASCVSSFTYAPDCFAGTSAAAPAAAGAAALVIDAGLATTPAQLKSY